MATLELRFRRDPAPVLIKTTFRHQARVTIVDRERDEMPFQWRSGIQAFVILLLSWVAWDRMRRAEDEGGGDLEEIPAFEATPGSAAASVKGYLGKRINWHDDIFGDDGGTLFRELIGIKVRDGRSYLTLNPAILEPGEIRVVADGRPIDDADQLEAMIEAIEVQRQGRSSADPAEPAGPNAPVKVKRPGPPGEAIVASEGAWQLAILHHRRSERDAHVADRLEQALRARGHRTACDRLEEIGTAWAREVERMIRESDAVIVLLSPASVRSEDLIDAVTVAHDERQQRQGRPYLLPVRLDYEGGLPRELARCLGRLPVFRRNDDGDDDRLLAELVDAMQRPQPSQGFGITSEEVPLGDTDSSSDIPPPAEVRGPLPFGGLLPDDECYVERPTDATFASAVGRGDSVVLIRGSRQVGKTSLLARGVRQARSEVGARVVYTDLQGLNQSQLKTPEAFFRALSAQFLRQLGRNGNGDGLGRHEWDPDLGANANFEEFLQEHVLRETAPPLVWALDEVDRLFTSDFGCEVFGLFRSWHNARSFDPDGPWTRLTLAISYATEAHLFIQDLNQSPFNIGTLVALEDFTVEQVDELNRRRGHPLRTQPARDQFYRLVGGHPYLTNRGLYEMARHGLDIKTFESQAVSDGGPLGDHFRRVLLTVSRDADLLEAMRVVLRGGAVPQPRCFYRLRAAGVLAGDVPRQARLRCLLYRIYLERHLL